MADLLAQCTHQQGFVKGLLVDIVTAAAAEKLEAGEVEGKRMLCTSRRCDAGERRGHMHACRSRAGGVVKSVSRQSGR